MVDKLMLNKAIVCVIGLGYPFIRNGQALWLLLTLDLLTEIFDLPPREIRDNVRKRFIISNTVQNKALHIAAYGYVMDKLGEKVKELRKKRAGLRTKFCRCLCTP